MNAMPVSSPDREDNRTQDFFDELPGRPAGRSAGRPTAGRAGAPSVDLLLEIDLSYRKKAASGRLPKVAPARLNRSGIAWLPILQDTFAGWQCTVRFSNTLRANQLGKTSDWVIINYKNKAGLTGRATVVTEIHGGAKGQRVVRGREHEAWV